MPYTDFQKQQHIAELQKYLQAIDRDEGRKTSVIPDGVYGSNTSAAVREFQRTHGLPVTGDTDAETWDEIVAVYRNGNCVKPQPYPAFPSAEYVCQNGCSGILVYVIQAMLCELGKSYDNLTRIDICGNYNIATAGAVEDFQRKCGLTCTGTVDCQTWNMLVACCGHKF